MNEKSPPSKPVGGTPNSLKPVPRTGAVAPVQRPTLRIAPDEAPEGDSRAVMEAAVAAVAARKPKEEKSNHEALAKRYLWVAVVSAVLGVLLALGGFLLEWKLLYVGALVGLVTTLLANKARLNHLYPSEIAAPVRGLVKKKTGSPGGATSGGAKPAGK